MAEFPGRLTNSCNLPTNTRLIEINSNIEFNRWKYDDGADRCTHDVDSITLTSPEINTK